MAGGVGDGERLVVCAGHGAFFREPLRAERERGAVAGRNHAVRRVGVPGRLGVPGVGGVERLKPDFTAKTPRFFSLLKALNRGGAEIAEKGAKA